ncbi:glycosyltransferase family 39 protein [Polaribacter vadi]|uniref:ArnT family glycosyltransferase n=1 Tax=Polaribacter TaxID=52959 RepID=UPI001C0820E4|nr:MULTISPECIES: glycosyltransferase family 39 protein [Polaribacter]MBU3012037.1 glycosyltransferase family 39 protein [Polaribacter vadi]MDO6741852.1 glycosyltransferase family 39 protein [Polaribacter sp. 1_MG-2023]
MLAKFLSKENNLFFLIFTLILIVTIIGLPLDLIDPDAALYASISKSIAEGNDYINLYSLGHDWLDKPHLPFWLTAISYKIFGVTNFAYKLPAVLIFFFGIYTTYKFTKNNYNTKTGIYAAIILATATHSIISNFDVRAEAYLTAFMISSIYYFDVYLKNKRIKHLIFACLFSAFAIMTKGIFAMIPIIAALGGELFLKRKWKQIINPIWLFATVLIFIFILPELYTLYVQFDMHPEKLVFERNNVSGLKFFFWDSQFGRFFNSGPIKGTGDKTFFLHTILWAFLPFGILFYIATFSKVKRNLKKIITKEEFYSLFGCLSAIIIFSLSKFQLAHYTNIVFPFMAIIVADFIDKLSNNRIVTTKGYAVIFWFQNVIAILIIGFLFYVMQPEFNFVLLAVLAFSIFIFRSIYKSKNSSIQKLFLVSTVFFLNIYTFLFTHFYPTILPYQGGVSAARFVNKNYKGKGSLLDNMNRHFAFEYYLKDNFKRIDTLKIHQEKGRIFYLNKKEIDLFKRQNVNFKIIKEIENFAVSRINNKFLKKDTRKEALEIRYLVEVN